VGVGPFYSLRLGGWNRGLDSWTGVGVGPGGWVTVVCLWPQNGSG